jgi:hypothetical protein
VDIGKVVQSQTGLMNREVMRIGNNGSEGTVHVTIGSIVQKQRGLFRRSSINIGNQ